MASGIEEKIKTRAELAELLAELRAAGRCCGFSSGTFDLLHAGHVSYLAAARSRCDVLVVGVNSDQSVRSYKAPERPILGEQERAQLVAALGCVDYVFIFPEPNNQINIKTLKPDIYLKAGDYQRNTLSSAPLVEAYGGRVELLPFVGGCSSSGIIERILERYGAGQVPFAGEPKAGPVVFLDRDGTIIEDTEYLHQEKDLRFLPGAIAALQALQAAGFKLVIVTNQPGIGLGYYNFSDFFRVNKAFLREVSAAGVSIAKIYFCPHSQAAQCRCRKPQTALAERAQREVGVDLKSSFMVGDSYADMEFGRRLGVRTVLVGSKEGEVAADFRAADLAAATQWILANLPVGAA